ncbi:MAG: STAS domain-containing protein [Acidobacteria bacterium]|nr:STAS domain-containing protein [Acidobacteriota bacterium]
MFLEKQQFDEILVLEPSIESLDSRNADEFHRKLTEIIDNGHARLVLNMEPLKFVDSRGIGAVIVILKRLEGQGHLVLCSLQEPVMATFRLTRLDRVCDITDTVAEAVRLIRQN